MAMAGLEKNISANRAAIGENFVGLLIWHISQNLFYGCFGRKVS
ncbi:hypothetical protein MNBD_ALPHA11-1733 [hydrothermal vent metagenome]|uniref:Uncharacterized protein n=1 Tax=hydrothermal vent metagenome TaxID=652676 RepID=A0A3B0U7J9_9ZZZZ